MLRSFASMFGSSFLFRVLARFYLPFAPVAYSGWLPMIFMSWLIPNWIIEQYISYVQYQKRVNKKKK